MGAKRRAPEWPQRNRDRHRLIEILEASRPGRKTPPAVYGRRLRSGQETAYFVSSNTTLTVCTSDTSPEAIGVASAAMSCIRIITGIGGCR